MARIIGATCTCIVGLQVLVGVPLAVCGAFFCLTNGPITVEVQAGQGQTTPFSVQGVAVQGATIPPPNPFALAPPPNAIPVAPVSAIDNPILASRAEHGSPLAGTVLETVDPAEEQSTFVAALEKAAAEQPAAVCPVLAVAEPVAEPPSADTLIVGHLYEMAEIDERSGDFERADQWRAFAREIREPKRDRKSDEEI
jgi:hypothetical protein